MPPDELTYGAAMDLATIAATHAAELAREEERLKWGISYDKGGDVLYWNFRPGTNAIAEDDGNDVYVRRDSNGKIAGVTVIQASDYFPARRAPPTIRASK